MIMVPVPPATPNVEWARQLRRTATLLERQEANAFRIRAYRRAADTLETLEEPVAAILERDGPDGLSALPGIGQSIAWALAEGVRTGRVPTLARLEGQEDPLTRLAGVPGIGPAFASRIHHELGIGSLEDLEAAAWDGRLDAVRGFGPRRVAGIRGWLASRLDRSRTVERLTREHADRPPVAELLAVDREYRRKARAEQLVTIAPRRFNPGRRRWLPVLHTARSGRDYTALFSNTAMAHRLGRTDDWVVVYYDGSGGEGQATVVTERSGSLRGRRVVRGREAECRAHYGIFVAADPHAATDGDGII